MLCRAEALIGRRVIGANGDVGTIKDIFFDDLSWNIRYVVVDTGTWLSSRDVLLTPAALYQIEIESDQVVTRLTKQQVEDSPPVVADAPVTRAYEERLFSHYGWTPYWNMPLYAESGLYMYPLPPDPSMSPEAERGLEGAHPSQAAAGMTREGDTTDSHLRSFKEVDGYHIEATDGDIGHLDDLLFDTNTWRVTHFIIDTRNWLPGRHVVVDRGTVRALRWEDGKAEVNLTRMQVKESPEYSPELQIDESYQRRLSSYYRTQSNPRFPGESRL